MRIIAATGCAALALTACGGTGSDMSLIRSEHVSKDTFTGYMADHSDLGNAGLRPVERRRRDHLLTRRQQPSTR
jgi:hypothetical protein